MASAADIPLNQHLGITYQEDAQCLRLPDEARVRNYFGSVSFCAQFALAEAASAQYLFDRLGMDLSTDLPTLRNASTKFLKPTGGTSTVGLVSLQHTCEEFQEALRSRRKIITKVVVEVISETGVKALESEFTWLVLRHSEKS